MGDPEMLGLSTRPYLLSLVVALVSYVLAGLYETWRAEARLDD